jgi:hypothetical protein
MSGAKKQFATSANYHGRSEGMPDRFGDELTVPKGATTDAGANPYEMKLPISPTFMRKKPNHLQMDKSQRQGAGEN